MVGNDKAVNPFVQKMYYRISFNTWLNAMRKEERIELHEQTMLMERQRAQRLGIPFIERKLEDEVQKLKLVTYDQEREILITDEEDSEEERQELDTAEKKVEAEAV